MAFSLIWLPEILKNAGLKIALVDGWENRGKGDAGPILGVMCHHTVGPKKGNMPSLNTLIHGRAAGPNISALPGPLSQLGLGRDGTYYIIAAGRCNHAGAGIWQGLVNGNSNFIGIEAENTGLANDFPWPEVQMDAYRRGVAAILKHIGRSALFCCGHKEYALPKGRKPDVSFDMHGFRASIADILTKGSNHQLIPAFEPPPQTGGMQGRPTLRRGINHVLVKVIQTKLNLQPDGIFGGKTEAAIRAFQHEHGLVPDGIVGPKSWKFLDQLT